MNYKDLTDQELIDLFVSGEEPCIKELFRRHKSRIFTYIMLIVKDRELAEDIFQETFIKVIKSLRKGRYMDKGIFLGYLYWLKDFFSLHFGDSWWYTVPVIEKFKDVIWLSFTMGLMPGTMGMVIPISRAFLTKLKYFWLS